jgi:hypothetical protein
MTKSNKIPLLLEVARKGNYEGKGVLFTPVFKSPAQEVGRNLKPYVERSPITEQREL